MPCPVVVCSAFSLYCCSIGTRTCTDDQAPPPARQFAARRECIQVYLQEEPPKVERCLYLIICDDVITAADPEWLLYKALMHNSIARVTEAKRLKP
jgi:hypothetical protein